MTSSLRTVVGGRRILIEKVITEWDDNSNLLYLFANDSVLDFYPRFRFITREKFTKLIT
ncbi:hypothetical protein [Cellulosilyticum sp. I15G10I2]|uniref:hypothetical protein n=1 Tax=Cellulosilyticum sp. I15G10I2 TaxID=1892843 RepID=UPI001495B98F|nr:hypothetical protein [Cellulosilyticum sp. I15G10I2]